MTVKEQLNSIRDCQIRIQNKQEELRQLEKLSVEAQNFKNDKVQISHTGSETERLVIEITARQQEITEEWIRLVRRQKEIVRLIESVDDVVLYDILHRRYVQCQTWKEITKQTGYSETHLYRLHKKALEIIISGVE